MIKEEFPHVTLLIPTARLSTDNAIMIGMAGYFKILRKGLDSETPEAQGALRLAS
jgi:tRNA A37 threonylcarbamoyltransferase TsaD